MSRSAITTDPGRIAAPRQSHGHAVCPRCVGRLFFDGEDLVCLRCGYAPAWSQSARATVLVSTTGISPSAASQRAGRASCWGTPGPTSTMHRPKARRPP